MTAPTPPHDPQLLRGVLPLLILTLLQGQESYGYELVERLRALGLTQLATGAVYPVLSRFERDGLLSSYTRKSQSGPARKYYLLTAHGQQAQKEAARKWQDISQVAARGLSLPAPANSSERSLP